MSVAPQQSFMPAPPSVLEGTLLWTPDAARIEDAPVERFRRWVNAHRGLDLADYDALWQWSVSDLEAFWSAVWDYFGIRSTTPYRQVLDRRVMPGARWFEGSQVNYAEHLLRHERVAPDAPALLHASELRPLAATSWRELGRQVRRLAAQLRRLGVRPGDHVAAYLPNIPETAIAMMASVAVGAVWSAASPEFGANAVIDRLQQVRPKVLFAVDGYRFGGRDFDRRDEVRRICDGLGCVERLIGVSYLRPQQRFDVASALSWTDLLADPDTDDEAFEFERVGFDHPLWVLFTSGTTGLPKATVHSHVGVLLEHYKLTGFHVGIEAGTRALYHSTTGWMMWNVLIATLLHGGTAVLYDGSPIAPDPAVLWRLAEQTRAEVFGVSPAYVQILQRRDYQPQAHFELDALRTVLLTGAPSMPETFTWFYQAVKRDLWVTSQSGGTEAVSAFIAATPTKPVRAGEMQVRALGMDVHVWDDDGRERVDEVGELVLTAPFPSMPLRLLDDPDGQRYREAYFQTYLRPGGVWHHGDYMKLTAGGGCYIYGRSDAMLNRYGVCIGTAEIYRSVERVEAVVDSLVVCCEMAGGRIFIPMFLKLAPGVVLDRALRERIALQLRTDCSPRHVPDQMYVVDDIPYTLTGKKMEVPVRNLLMGGALHQVASRDAMMNPAAIDWFVRFRADNLAMLLG